MPMAWTQHHRPAARARAGRRRRARLALAGASFFDELGDALAVNPPLDRVERRTLRRFAALGIGPGRHPTTELHDRRKLEALAHGVTAGNARITAAAATPGTTDNGWCP